MKTTLNLELDLSAKSIEDMLKLSDKESEALAKDIISKTATGVKTDALVYFCNKYTDNQLFYVFTMINAMALNVSMQLATIKQFQPQSSEVLQ